MSKEKAGQWKIHDDCILIGDSGSDEEFESNVAGMSTKNWNTDYVVIDSDSDDGHCPKENEVEDSKSGKDEIWEEFSDTDEQFPIIISDDDDDTNVKGPVITEEDATKESQIFSVEKEMEQFALSQCNSSNDTGENICQPPKDAEVEVEISDINKSPDGDRVPVVGQPKKRKYKTNNICVPSGSPIKPNVRGQRRAPSSENNPRAASSKKYNTGTTDCNIPGCFLRDIEKLKQYSGRNFKKNKDELIRKLYALMNKTVFKNMLPENLDIRWNNKMLRTAGLCSSGQLYYQKERYTRIEISQKVCDSADRIRDTLIHELCHAASWLLDGIRDSHGDMWRYYAKKCNVVHPELPLVTRCHNYKINYRIYYECSQCKTRVGRYTRSLNVERFVCAECKGPLVLLPLTRKDGTPIKPHVRPFAKYVEEHYRLVRQQTAGITHGDVMKTLRKDYFLCKQKQNL